jgi:hypothetical protein
MADLTFPQQERRSYLVPGLLALVILGLIGGYIYWRVPHRMADAAVTHLAVYPVHTVLSTGSRLVGAGDQAQDDLYVLATIHIDNRLHIPLFLSDFTATYTAADDTVTQTGALEERDFADVFTTFPALKPLAGNALRRESTIDPDGHADGTIILHFPITQVEWDQRKSASISVAFYHQDPLTIPIPKEQGTGNSK